MTDTATGATTVEYKVILAASESKMVYAIPDGNVFRLPRVRIPKWTRPAEEITRELRENWNLNTIVLTLLSNGESQPVCVVAEVMDARNLEDAPSLRLSSLQDIARTELDVGELDHVSGVLSGKANPGPFSRPGWLRDVQRWMHKSLPDRRIDFTDEFRQYNAGNAFSLMRFATRYGPAYWLKATGGPNTHEFAVTVTLSELFPQYLPPLVAVREDWNAWITEDAGIPLGSSQTLPVLTQAVEALAELQMQSLAHMSRLEGAGCFDMRLVNVHAHLAELIEYLEEAMGHQTSTRVLPLRPPRLQEIRNIVEEACLEMQDLNIPSSLVNGDINLDNILYDGSRATFTDWSEAGFGNPFLTLQQLIQHVIRDGEHLEWETSLRRAYKQKWRTVVAESQIDRAFVLMPVLTMTSYLYGRGDWLSSPRRNDPSFQSFARTMARHMDRAAADPALIAELRRSPCA